MFIYFINSTENYYKIGVSSNPKKRIKQLQTGNLDKLTLFYEFKSNYPFKLEKALHNKFNLTNKNGEWFEISYADICDIENICIKFEHIFNILKENENPFI